MMSKFIVVLLLLITSTTSALQQIIGGNAVSYEDRVQKYSYIAYLRGNHYKKQCAATLITSNTLLTNARCVTDALQPPTEVVFNYMEWDFIPQSVESNYDAEKIVRISEIIVHPHFHVNPENDIALIKLDKSIDSRVARPVKLASNTFTSTEINHDVFVLGWGKTKWENTLPEYVYPSDLIRTLMIRRDLMIGDDVYCEKTAATHCFLFSAEKQVCLSPDLRSSRSVASVYSGDTGSPLMVSNNVLVGIVKHAGWRKEVAPVFIRVGAFRTFIDRAFGRSVSLLPQWVALKSQRKWFQFQRPSSSSSVSAKRKELQKAIGEFYKASFDLRNIPAEYEREKMAMEEVKNVKFNQCRKIGNELIQLIVT